jgi:hypothetical protein
MTAAGTFAEVLTAAAPVVEAAVCSLAVRDVDEVVQGRESAYNRIDYAGRTVVWVGARLLDFARGEGMMMGHSHCVAGKMDAARIGKAPLAVVNFAVGRTRLEMLCTTDKSSEPGELVATLAVDIAQ